MTLSDNNTPLKFLVGDQASRIIFCSRDSLLSIPGGMKSLAVFDSNTSTLFPDFEGTAIILPSGEEAKNIESVQNILSSGIEAGLARDGLIIGVGGGVICDMAAFSASVYMRGCRIILVPTTLLSMIDASLGGKTGVDFKGYKNMAGTFYPAEEIRICPEILSTLSDREYLSGLAEVIKHAFLGKSGLLELLSREREAVLGRSPEILSRIIRDSLIVKGDFVQRDFRERGDRAFLNLGHTFGHALETASGFSGWTHGEAVAWGMDKAFKAGVLMGITDPEYADEASMLLSSYGYRLSSSLNPEDIISAMDKDKKKRYGRVLFVLQKARGETIQSEIPGEILLKVLS